MEALEREQLPEERGRHERAPGVDERAQRAGQHPVQRRVGFAVLGDLVDRFEHRDRVREQRVLLAQHPVGFEGLGLGHDVEIAALVALQRDPGGRLEAGPELARRLADPLGDGPDLAVALREDRDDPVGLTELDRPEHHSLVAIQPRHITRVYFTCLLRLDPARRLNYDPGLGLRLSDGPEAALSLLELLDRVEQVLRGGSRATARR